MSKATVTRLFVAGLIALGGGLVLLLVAGGLALANSTFVMDGPDVVGFRTSPFGWVMIGLACVALIVLLAAALVQFVAWVGAVVNTGQLPDKTWFIVLLLTGLLSFGFVAMIVYLIAGPPDPVPAPDEPGAPAASS